MTSSEAAIIIWIAFATAFTVIGFIVYWTIRLVEYSSNNTDSIDYDAMFDGGTYVTTTDGDIRFENYDEEMFQKRR